MDTIKSNQNKDIEDLHLDQKPKILAKPTPSKKQSVFADIRIPTTDVVTLEKSPQGNIFLDANNDYGFGYRVTTQKFEGKNI